MSMKTTFTIEEIVDALCSESDGTLSADDVIAKLLDISIDKLFDLKEEYMEDIVDKLQNHVSSLSTNEVELFCGFELNEMSKGDAVYQAMTQMPDDVICEYYHEYFN